MEAQDLPALKMSEIPGPVWIAVGILIGGFSIYLGFINTSETSTFFQLMTVVGLGMIIFGVIKLKFPKKSKQDVLDEMSKRRTQRGNTEVDIDMQDYKSNPQLRQTAMQHKQNFQQRYSTPHNVHQHTQHRSQQHQPQHQAQHSAAHQAQRQTIPNSVNLSKSHPLKKSKKVAGYCGNCGSPLLKKHKFCPICGARI